MAAGMPEGYALEIFFSGSWTDVSADVIFADSVALQYGRTREGEDVAPGSMDFRLFNNTGNYTPDNPLSIYYPNVRERKRVRLKVTKGGVTRTRFSGYIVSWKPSIPTGESVTQSTVDIVASTFDGAANKPLISFYGMQFGPVDDYWPLNEAGDYPEEFHNRSQSPGVSAVRVESNALAEVEQSGSGVAITPERLDLEGGISFQPVNNKGPVVLFDRGSGGDFTFWFRAIETPTAQRVMATFLVGGKAVSPDSFSLRINSSTGNLTVYDGNGSLEGTLASSVTDGKWRRINIGVRSGPVFEGNCIVEGETSVATLNWASGGVVSYAVFGGLVAADELGSQTLCAAFELAGVGAIDEADLPPAADALLTGTTSLSSYVTGLDLEFGKTTTVQGSTDVTIGHPSQIGLTLAAARSRAASTVGAVAWFTPDGTAELRLPDAVRTATPVLTFDLEADGNGLLEVSREVDSIPTRVSVNYPTGTVTVVDIAAEVGDVTLETSVDAFSSGASQATDLATFLLAENGELRINKIGLSLAGGVNDNYAEAAALYPGARVRIENLPSTFFGYTQKDVIVQGWREIYSLAGVDLELDTTPADSPRESTIESDDRIAATDTTLTSTITSSDTSLSLTIGASGEVWSTDSGDYPLKIRIGGEIITAPSAPASGSAPSWTGCTRGVDGTVAAAHTAGAAVDVAYPISFGF